MLVRQTLEQFAAELAAPTPTPGGGSAAALAGALSASLVTMVCDLSIGREKFKAHDDVLRAARARAVALQKDLLALVDRDADAFASVMRAVRLPKGTDAERRSRSEAVGRATLFATETPLATAEACAVLLGLAVDVAYKGNPNAISDAGSAALLAYAGLRGGVMNVRANLGGIADADRAARLRDKVRRLEVEAEKRREEALGAVFAGTTGR